MGLCQKFYSDVKDAIDGKFLYGNSDLICYSLVAFLARGHLLLEGAPGTGKTMTVRTLAAILAKTFSRIQFTSDMLPADITGAFLYSPADQKFNFVRGPIFADFILADEVNRTPPRTQSALLEAMEERQVTVEGHSFGLSPDFCVMATQNPREFEGTFPLPEAQLDRFMMKLKIDNVDKQTEAEMLEAAIAGSIPPDYKNLPKISFEQSEIAEEIAAVTIDKSLLNAVTTILAETRSHPMLQWGSSFRGGMALVKCSRIYAAFNGRDYVTPDDLHTLLLPCLRHRINLSPEARISEHSEDVILEEIWAKLNFPL